MEKMDFHIHSDYSDDGSASLEDIVTEALRWGLVAIGVVDHVRGDADWLADRKTRLSELQREHGKDIEIYSGIEVKVIDDLGALDLADNAGERADYVVASFHGTPDTIAEQVETGNESALIAWWCNSMHGLLEGKGRAQVIGHPDRMLTARNLAVATERFDRLLDAALASRMYLEWNPATNYPSQPFVNGLGNKGAANVIYASDAHSIEELADAYRGLTSFEAGIVDRGNASFLRMLRQRGAGRG